MKAREEDENGQHPAISHGKPQQLPFQHTPLRDFRCRFDIDVINVLKAELKV